MNQDRWPGCHEKPSWKCTKDQMTSQKLQSRPDSSMTRTVEKQKIIKFPSAPTQNFWLRKQIQRWYWMTEFFFFFLFYDWVLILKSYSGIQLKSITAFSVVCRTTPGGAQAHACFCIQVHSWWGSGDEMGCQGLDLGWQCARQVPDSPAPLWLWTLHSISFLGLSVLATQVWTPALTPVCHDFTR